MAKTDWTLNDIVRPEDMNNIGTEINNLQEEIDNIDIPPASLTEAGIVQLSNATNSTSEMLAATPLAVKNAYDRAEEAFQSGNERKQEVVDILIAKGISASISESWDSLLAKMTGIIKSTGNAVVADVITGKTFSNGTGNNLTGTMPNHGAGGTVTPGTTNQTKPAGYYSGPITVLGDADLVPGNIRSGVDLFGVVGSLVPRFFAGGNYYISSAGKIFVNANGTTSAADRFVEVTGLGFKPILIVITYGLKSMTLYKSGASFGHETAEIVSGEVSMTDYGVSEVISFRTVSPAYVEYGSFLLPCVVRDGGYNNAQYWAFG